MEEVMIGFTKDDLDMIMEYQQVSGAVTVQAAIMNAISLALDHADDDVEIEDRKHGHWIEDESETYTPNHDTWECSECHEPFTLNEGTTEENKFYFCPRCGADMR